MLLAQVIHRNHKKRRNRPQGLLIDISDGENDDGISDEDDDSLARLTLQKTYSRGNRSMKELDKPTGEVWMVTFEFLLLTALLALNIILALNSSSHKRRASIAQSVVTFYLTAVGAGRLLLSTTTWGSPITGLWNHSAILYLTQWLLQVWVFRSVLVHPPDRLAQVLTIASFAITSALVVIALVSRKGNKGVLLEYEGDIEPSREPLASVLSLASFTWVDAIVWRGYKKTLELQDVWNLRLEDKAENVLAHFRQVQKSHSLAGRLLWHFKTELLIQGAWCMLASVFLFLPTMLLKAILEYLENTDTIPVSAAWLYVTLLFATSAVPAVGDGQALWIGRRICIQLRAIIVGEIYSKTLRRKATASADTDLGKEDNPAKESFLKRVQGFWKRQKQQDDAAADSILKKATGTQANNGTIINLMSIDSFKVAEVCAYLHFLWAAVPVQLIMAVSLLYKVLGFSSFAGIILMILILPLNLYIAKSFQAAQKRIMTATDGRIHVTNEVLQNIRIIKYFAWEQRFKNSVNEKRKIELAALWRKYVLWSSAATIWSGVPILITFISFLIYTQIEKRPLVPSIAFPALSMFSLLRIPLDQLADMVAHVQESKVSVDRVEKFLEEEETEKYAQLRQSRRVSLPTVRIALDNATLTWGLAGPDANEAFRLIDVNVDFVIGELNVIAGPTGSGKTSLLMALLGEMQLVNGSVYIPGGSARQDLRPDPATGLTDSVAYCAQQAWLVNATIKENILFASPYDEDRYHQVISICALERDLEILDAGDQTLVGEKGITLSGGQKQRISLARAIYSNSKHLLLDDCLSAVDAHTAKHIFEEALTGELMAQRTCILVSHNVSLTVPLASWVVVLENGKIASQGTPQQIVTSGALRDELLKSQTVSRANSEPPSRVPSNLEEERSKLSGGNANGTADSLGTTTAKTRAKINKPEKQFVDHRLEAKATGSVKLSTIQMYLKAMGPWYYWIIAGWAFIATQLGSVATNLWIRQWANAYHLQDEQVTHAAVHAFHHTSNVASMSSFGSSYLQVPWTAVSKGQTWIADTLDDVDAGYYLGVYAIIGAVYVFICFSREIILFWGSQRASWFLHEKLLSNILRAKFRFFDSTPLGQLTNRFSKDIQALDQEVAPVAIGLLHSAASVVTIVILISAITPGFLIPGVFITIMYILTGLFYIRSSRDLKRIEAVQRSPLFQHFGETLTGVVTIRAYGDEARFISESNLKVNTHNRPFIYLWATNRWLAFRIDIAGALVSFFSATFVVLNAGRIDPGAAGLALSYAITFSQNVLWLVRLYAANEQNMNAVERIQEYIDVDQEAPADIPETKPAANWPSHGTVEFVGYSTRYRPDLEPVLKKVSFRIEAAQKVGIVGRTGAGKSSLALALFRGLEAEEGKILIDDVDVGLIGLQDLREAITIVPQDPTLFAGTLRSNLDPFELFTDEEVFTALRRVQLISGIHPSSGPSGSSTPLESSTRASTLREDSSPLERHDPSSANGTMKSDSTLVRTKENKNIFRDLSSPVAESGSNLSQGQRQLLCLARALLKAPKVLVMDEATASIDYATDSKIQDTLRELKNNTILTIAHRLQTIIDYDRVLVLDKGEVVEYAEPWQLIQKEDGHFRAMCQTSGEFDALCELAKKAWQDKRLVDVS